jgi:phospholipase/carboxylesterase
MRSLIALLVAALMWGGSSGSAAPVVSAIKARPANVALTLPVGVSRVGNSAFAYRPAGAGDGPLPLIVLLHGAGGDARSFLELFTRAADRRGALLLAPQSIGRTWNLKAGRKGQAGFGADVGNLDRALAELFAEAPVDPARVVLLGFSDGASYALSLGIPNSQLFRGVVALSPGFAVVNGEVDTRQRLFIAHGRRDTILPFANTRDEIAAGLERAGFDLRTRWFSGGHEIDPAALDKGLDFALGKAN